LLSAQSHQALDNLLSTVRQTVVSSSNDAIIVRSRGTDEAASTAEDVRKTALSYLHRLHKSDLARSAPKLLRDNLQALTYAVQQAAEDVDHEALSPVGQREQAGFRALEALVLESANVVFSTSNSMDVERLSEDGAQFDWVIIEEAAKASGPDLIAPLSLSGRRLLIGDHYQLPPFDAERLRAILTNKTAIRAALNETGVLLGTTFFESGLEELQTEALDEANLDQICHLGLRALEPFRTLVEEDEKRRSIAGGQRRSVTSELLCQHRMDPAIARLVSRCFYHDRLETSDERVEQAREPLPFSFGDTFPTAPIVFVDMPLVSRSGKAEPIEFDRPRWHNPTERRVVSNLLDQLRGTSEEAPSTSRTLGILSPYRAQVERLKSKVDSLQAKQEFSWFRPFTHDGRFLATVDSSQGSEAALVLISLVRNSHKTGVAGLGFLRDPRRMNVLLSRAKLQLILIGSLEFLRESTRFTTPHAEFDLSFIRVFLETLDLLRNEIGLRGGPCAAVVDGTSWMES
jgi:superfamily I DNA and/or RNA helicase